MSEKTKTAKLIVFTITFIIIGAVLNFAVHELSHMLMLAICKGSVEEISFGKDVFVGGFVEYNYVSTVALASIFIPFIISFLISLFKSIYVSCFNLGFSLPIVLNVVLGFYAHFFIKDITVQNTYDLALACNFMEQNFLILLLSFAVLAIQVWIMTESFRKIKDKI